MLNHADDIALFDIQQDEDAHGRSQRNDEPKWVGALSVWLGVAVIPDIVFALAMTDVGAPSRVAEGIFWISLGTVPLVAVIAHAAAFVTAVYGLVRWSRRRGDLPRVRIGFAVAGAAVWLGMILLA